MKYGMLLIVQKEIMESPASSVAKVKIFLNICHTAMKQMAALREWAAFAWKESRWAGLPLH